MWAFFFVLQDFSAERLGCEMSMRDYVQADATKYVHHAPFHILVIESMLASLRTEPQVAITLNVTPQMRAGGALIPERICVDAGLCEAPHAGLPPANRIALGRIFELSRETTCGAGGQFPPIVVRLPDGIEKPLHVELRTTMKMFGEIELREFQSGLTQPIILHEAGGVRSGARLSIRYEMGSDPGFRSS
jgi:hypothetical protein